MAISVTWTGGDSLVTIASGSFIGFYGDNFNESIPLNNYNTSTFVTNDIGTSNSGVLPSLTYTTPGYTTGTSVVNGVISGSLSSLTSDDLTLRIYITSGSAVNLSSVNLIAYEGISTANVPSEVTVRAFEYGSTDWSIIAGAAAPLALTPSVSVATTHIYYIGLSVTPLTKQATDLSTRISFALEANWN